MRFFCYGPVLLWAAAFAPSDGKHPGLDEQVKALQVSPTTLDTGIATGQQEMHHQVQTVILEQAPDALAVAARYEHFSDATSAFWEERLAGDGRRKWYSKAQRWWLNQKQAPPTVNGVLGGYGNLDGVDIEQSSAFLGKMQESLCKEDPACHGRALDCGAGIGRVTGHLLSKFYDTVDLVEGNRRMLDAAPEFLKPLCEKKIGEYFCSALQDVVPAPQRYNAIWVQWVVIYLPDVDFVAFLQRCANALAPGGFIAIKDNVLDTQSDVAYVVDEDDSSLTRSPQYMEHIFSQANLEVFKHEPQVDFPKNMFPVSMYALRPKAGKAEVALAQTSTANKNGRLRRTER